MLTPVRIRLVVPLAALAREYFRAIPEKANLRSALTKPHETIIIRYSRLLLLRWVLRALKGEQKTPWALIFWFHSVADRLSFIFFLSIFHCLSVPSLLFVP